MALENYTTYTEVDTGNNRIVLVGTDHIDFVSSRNAEETYLYKDYGVDHFGDFTHKVDAKAVSGTWQGYVWGLSNTVDELLDDPLHIAVIFHPGGTAITLNEFYSSTSYTDSYVSLSLGTTYYLLIKKTGTAFKCGIYSTANLRDAGDATDGDIDNLALTLHADHKFRYVYGCSSVTLTQAELGTFDIDNLDLQEGAVVEASATLSGIGSVVAIGKKTILSSATLSGAGTLTAIGTIAGLHEASATLSGTGELVATTQVIRSGSATLSGAGTLSATAVPFPTAIKQAATNIGHTTARINGKISDDGGASCEARFRHRDMSDYGLNWVDLGTIATTGITSMAYLGNGIAILGDTANHVYRSTNYGLNWTDLGIITSNPIGAMVYLGNGIAILGTTGYHIHRSTNYGLNWTDLGIISTDPIYAMAYLGNGIAIFGDCTNHVYRSIDYGLNWADLGVIATDSIYSMAYLGNGIAILGDNAYHVYRSTNYGLNWTDLGVIASWPIFAMVYLGNGIAVLGDNAKHVYRSIDYGLNWTDLGVIASHFIYAMAYLGNGIVTLGDAVCHVYRSTNYGLNWTDLGVIASDAIRSMVYLGNGITIAGDEAKHVWRSTSAYEWIYTDWQNTLETNDEYYEDLTDLDDGTDYEFQTQAKNSSGEGEWSESAYFETLSLLRKQYLTAVMANRILNTKMPERELEVAIPARSLTFKVRQHE